MLPDSTTTTLSVDCPPDHPHPRSAAQGESGRQELHGPNRPQTLQVLLPMYRRIAPFRLLLLLAGVTVVGVTVRAAFNNPFGIQLRPLPKSMAEVWSPVIVREAPTNEASMVERSDGAVEVYFITKPASDSVSCLRSEDGGLTWSEPRLAFTLPGKAYYAVQALEAADGSLQAVYHLLGEGPGGYRGRLYEVYHTQCRPGETTWSPPRKVVPGYVGSIRGFTQLQSGRLVLAVAQAVPERLQPPPSGPDLGWHDTRVFTSDDLGGSWRESPDRLQVTLHSPNATRYGAIEPVLLEMRDKRVWMLVRDRQGRLWQSYSEDGALRWPPLERTRFISSDSPAELLRLRDGRILLLLNACQNWTNPRSYAMGGREVLQAALSDDEGHSWRGFREVLHETQELTRGDRGAAYASAVQNREGKLVVVSGQGEGKRAIFLLDPAWLEETRQGDDLSSGPVGWTQYGGQGLSVREQDGKPALSFPVAADRGNGASWNFPLGAAGTLTWQMRVPVGAGQVTVSLNDHFTRVDDRRAAGEAVFSMAWPETATEHWSQARLTWSGADGAAGEATLSVDGTVVKRSTVQRAAEWGVNYLRLDVSATTAGGTIGIAGAAAEVVPAKSDSRK